MSYTIKVMIDNKSHHTHNNATPAKQTQI